MTQNQIAYASLQETKRHNLAGEANAKDVLRETSRHNVAQESYWKESNTINDQHYKRIDAETQRHNLVSENISAYSAETQRMSANTQRYSAQEAARHNAATEAINAAQVQETQRHNVQTEIVSRVQAQASQTQAAAAQEQAEASTRNANTNFLNYDSNREKTESEINLNKVRETDLKSQVLKRQMDIINSSIATTSEAFKDYATGLNNIANGATNIIKLVPGI